MLIITFVVCCVFIMVWLVACLADAFGFSLGGYLLGCCGVIIVTAGGYCCLMNLGCWCIYWLGVVVNLVTLVGYLLC